MSTLALIEKNARLETLKQLRNTKAYSFKRVFLVEFIYAPFGISAFLFIPFFGQALGVICVALGLAYVFLTGSLRSLVAGVLGAVSSAILLTLFFIKLKTSALVVMYLFLALSVIISLSYIVFVCGALRSLMKESEASAQCTKE